MTDGNQYLRITLHNTAYLLPSEASFSIEQRDQLTRGDTGSPVTAWRTVRSDRWPAFYLDSDLHPARGDGWQRAIFLDRSPHPLGLIADEVQLLPRSDVLIEPFNSLGPSPSAAGPIFSGVWMREDKMVLVFDPQGLIGYLGKLWNN